MEHVVADHQVKLHLVEIGAERISQGALKKPAALHPEMVSNGASALVEHLSTGLNHSHLGLRAAIKQRQSLIAWAWTNHKHMTSVRRGGPDGSCSNLIEHVIARHGVLDALAIVTAVITVEIQGGHPASAQVINTLAAFRGADHHAWNHPNP